MQKLKNLFFVLMLLTACAANVHAAYDGSDANVGGKVFMDGVIYEVVDDDKSVFGWQTNGGYPFMIAYAAYQGINSAVIRANMTYNNKNYKVLISPGSKTERTYENRKGFSGCTNLESVTIVFPETGENGLNQIPEYCFNGYTSLESLDLPEGIREIGYRAFQHLSSLKTINLPNTLTKIQGHFLCDCPQITSLVIPYNVTNIDGAFLHGCDNLTSVYLLGPASALQASDGVIENSTFGPYAFDSSPTKHAHVHDCTFYVNGKKEFVNYILASSGDEHVWARVNRYTLDSSDAWADNYEPARVTAAEIESWGMPAGAPANMTAEGAVAAYEAALNAGAKYNYLGSENTEFYGSSTMWANVSGTYPASGKGYRNQYIFDIPSEREFAGGKWVTACFPFGVSNVEGIFGAGTKVAVLYDATATSMIENGKLVGWYHMKFKLVNTIEADKPYLIKPAQTVNYKMFSSDNANVQEMTQAHWTKDVRTEVNEISKWTKDYENGTVIEAPVAGQVHMVGNYLKRPLTKSEFIFKSYTNGSIETGRIYKIANTGTTTNEPYRCFFQVYEDDVQVSYAKVGDFDMFEDITGIQQLDAEATNELREEFNPQIFNMQGVRMNVNSVDELPRGLYIVNGKKMLVK